mmetsp:Transcript_6623/g.16339  ORF Transcript_6623/g.16339 Transcript_6623/m.16339 type:complete len:82 (+) Transcript_6623:165-410(+)
MCMGCMRRKCKWHWDQNTIYPALSRAMATYGNTSVAFTTSSNNDRLVRQLKRWCLGDAVVSYHGEGVVCIAFENRGEWEMR